MLDMDPPAHTRLRAIVNKGFTPKIINTYEERIRDLSRRVLADAFARDELDFVHDVSMEIPMRVFAELLGAPAEDRRLLIAIGDRMLGNTDPEQVRDDPVYGREDAASTPTCRSRARPRSRCSPTATAWPSSAGPSLATTS